MPETHCNKLKDKKKQTFIPKKEKLNENNSFSFFMNRKLTAELTEELLCWQTMLHYSV